MRNDIKIGIDVCGTLMKWSESLERVYRRELPNKWINFPPTKYDVSKFVEIGDTVFDRAYHDWASDVYLNAAAFSGAEEFMIRLRDAAGIFNWEVYLLTYQPNAVTYKYTKDWLGWFKDVADKIVCVKKINKHKYVDILLDDCPEVLETAKNNGTKAVAWKHEYNKDFSGDVVSNYDEFMEILKQYVEE